MPVTRVAHVVERLSRGGASRSLIGLAHSLPDDVASTIVSLMPAEQAVLPLLDTAKVRLINGESQAVISREISNTDIVHVHFWNTPEIYNFLRCDAIHGTESKHTRVIVWVVVSGVTAPHIITQELRELTDMLVVSCRAAQANVLAANSAVVFTAAEFSRLSSSFEKSPCQPRQDHEDTFRMGYIGTVDPIKMHPGFVELAAGVKIRGRRFPIFGSGNGFGELRTRATNLGIADDFEFHGYTEDVAGALDGFDVFAYPLSKNTYASTDIILQEALYEGVPPVIFPLGGLVDIVEHNKTGLIVNSNDEYQRALEYLFHNPDRRKTLGTNARDFARSHLGANRSAAAFAKLYQEALSQPKRRNPSTVGAFSGAEFFIRSLGSSHPEFQMSFAANTDISQREQANRLIAAVDKTMWAPGGGGVLHYRAAFPHDPHLRFWSGLILENQGRPALAAAEFMAAKQLGLDSTQIEAWRRRSDRQCQ